MEIGRSYTLEEKASWEQELKKHYARLNPFYRLKRKSNNKKVSYRHLFVYEKDIQTRFNRIDKDCGQGLFYIKENGFLSQICRFIFCNIGVENRKYSCYNVTRRLIITNNSLGIYL